LAAKKRRYKVYTDGSYSKENRVGAYGFIVIRKEGDDDVRVKKHGETIGDRTIEIGETLAVLEALKCVFSECDRDDQVEVHIYSDSKMIVKAFNEYIPNWVKRSHGGVWNASNGKPVANQDLYKEILGLYSGKPGVKIRFIHVRAHEESEYNNEVDALVYNLTTGKERDAVAA
jgi:ribonuclease HI